MSLLLALTLAWGPQEEPVALRGVTWIDLAATDSEAARQIATTVVFRGDEILAVGPSSELIEPDGATVIDGGGLFLLPGLFDMHVHLGGMGDSTFTSMVLHGVTSARDLGGDLEQLDATLARVERGELVGPRVARAGYVLEEAGWLERVLAQQRRNGAGAATFMERTRIGLRTEDDVLEAVARVYESGADLLKFRNTPPPHLFRFLMEEAKLAGLRVAGHEPNSIDLLEAVTLGIGSIEHTPIDALIRGTSDERWQSIFAAMVEHDVHITPTFVALANRRLTADEFDRALVTARTDARFASLGPQLREVWESQAAERRSENSSIDWQELLDRSEEVVHDMNVAGVPFLAGTDLGVAFVYPGSSLLEELVALVEVGGLGTLDALRSATSHPASWLGWERLGAVRPGYRADLLLLEADPLLDIENVMRIHTVVSRGIVYGPEARARLSREIGEAAQR